MGRGISNLQRLRRAAGYRTASEFADSCRIPMSTYCRYERQGGEGQRAEGIPMHNAVVMADKLGCSLDLLIGREPIEPVKQGRDTLDARVSRLSRSGREMHEDFMRYLEFREREGADLDWR